MDGEGKKYVFFSGRTTKMGERGGGVKPPEPLSKIQSKEKNGRTFFVLK